MSLYFFLKYKLPSLQPSPHLSIPRLVNNTRTLHHLSDGARIGEFLSVKRRFKFIERFQMSLYLFFEIQTALSLSKPPFVDPKSRKIIQRPFIIYRTERALLCS